MKQGRRNHSPAFKARVALDFAKLRKILDIRPEWYKPLAEIAAQCGTEGKEQRHLAAGPLVLRSRAGPALLE
ncbi:MAG: hypothetical protein HYU29_02125 [Chloroflexi bacterium]|nr:hypothetical protein [Chloroflexota bacterium]